MMKKRKKKKEGRSFFIMMVYRWYYTGTPGGMAPGIRYEVRYQGTGTL